MPVEGFHPAQELAVVAQRDEHLRVVADRLLQHGQRTLRDLVLKIGGAKEEGGRKREVKIIPMGEKISSDLLSTYLLQAADLLLIQLGLELIDQITG